MRKGLRTGIRNGASDGLLFTRWRQGKRFPVPGRIGRMERTTVRKTRSRAPGGDGLAAASATIHCLAEWGYARSSVAKICERAGVTQGALFRHFPTRQALVASTTAKEIGRRHVVAIESFGKRGPCRCRSPRILAPLLRRAARSTAHAAWHGVMVAARTDEELRGVCRQPLQDFESALLHTVNAVAGPSASPRTGAIVLSILHAFDSEAVTIQILNPELERERLKWAEDVLREALYSDSLFAVRGSGVRMGWSV